MIGIILLVVSWLLLRLERKNLSELGFNLPLQRSKEFMIGFLLTGFLATAQQITFGMLAHFTWSVNQDFTTAQMLESIRWNFNSVVYEELIFRGYLLYKLIQWTGGFRATVISSVTFGIYHWFSFNLWSDPVSMAFVFLFTGIFGLAMAVSFWKSKSVFLPIGLHLGWNFISYLVFSGGPIGKQWLVATTSGETIQLEGILSLLVSVIIPLIPAFIVLAYYYVGRAKS